MVVAPEEYADVTHRPTSRRLKQELLALAGVWRDLDADHVIQAVYEARHAVPDWLPSRAVGRRRSMAR